MAPQFRRAAPAFDSGDDLEVHAAAVQFHAVNYDEHKPLCQHAGVHGYPSVRFKVVVPSAEHRNVKLLLTRDTAFFCQKYVSTVNIYEVPSHSVVKLSSVTHFLGAVVPACGRLRRDLRR